MKGKSLYCSQVWQTSIIKTSLIKSSLPESQKIHETTSSDMLLALLVFTTESLPKLWVTWVAQSSEAPEKLQLCASQAGLLLTGYMCTAAQKPAKELSWAPCAWSSTTGTSQLTPCHALHCPTYNTWAWVWGGPWWELLPEGRVDTALGSAALQHYHSRCCIKVPSWTTRKPAQMKLCDQRSTTTCTHSVISMPQAHNPASRHLPLWHSTWHLGYPHSRE